MSFVTISMVGKRDQSFDVGAFRKMPGVGTMNLLEREVEYRLTSEQATRGIILTNKEKLRLTQRFWLEIGAVSEDRVRLEYMRLTKKIGLSGFTAPKMLRHMFATTLQEGRVDPLIRNELLGRVASGDRSAGHGLAMTAVYTNTRPETKREQFATALSSRTAVEIVQRRFDCNECGRYSGHEGHRIGEDAADLRRAIATPDRQMN